MTRLFTAGAEEANVTQTFLVQAYAPIVSNPTARTGKGCYFAMDNGGNIVALANPTEIYLGCAIYQTVGFDDSRTTIYIVGPTIYVRLKLNGAVECTTPTVQTSAPGLVTLNTWHYLEIRIKPLNAGGILQVKLDGTLIIDYTGDTTGGSEYVSQVRFAGIDGGKETCYDDIVINDTTGSYNNSWPGQVRLLPIRAKAAGDVAQFTRAGIDMGENYAQVRPDYYHDGIFPSYVQSGSVDNSDLYVVDNPDLPAGAVIRNIIATAYGRIESGSGSMALLCKQGGNTSQGSDKVLSAGWTALQEVFPVNPADSAAWEEADLNGLQLGMKSR